MLVFGSLCERNGSFCGPEEGNGGGISMLLFGVLFAVGGLCYVHSFLRHSPAMLHNTWVLSVLYLVSTILLCFGSVCVDSASLVTGLDHKMCGKGGLQGGQAMIVFGTLMFAVAVGLGVYIIIYRREVPMLQVAVSILIISFLTAPVIMLIFGALCVEFEAHCGVRGKDSNTNICSVVGYLDLSL